MSLLHWVFRVPRPSGCPKGSAAMLAPSRLIAAIIVVVLLAACASPSTPPPASTSAQPTAPTTAPAGAPTSAPAVSNTAATAPVSGEIVVFAAASLTDVFHDMATALQHGQGARADVFASADTVQMDNATKSGAVSGQDRVFAGNRLVLITPKDNPAHISGVKDLANGGVKFVTAQSSVPIGTYTLQMLGKADADPNYGAGFKDKVVANTVSQEDNVRQVDRKSTRLNSSHIP